MRIRELRDRRQTIRAELTRFNDDMAKLRGELNTLLPQIHQLNDRRHQYQQMERQLQTQIGIAQFELSQLLH
jgi:chromosome segregation ATPase